jgi:hypothetical protein
MTYDNGMAYYVLNNAVYSLADNASSLPTTSLFDITASYAYGLSVRDSQLFVTDASFTANSTLLIYDIATGAETNSFSAPIGASKIYFN